MSDRADIVIIGGGVQGCSIAYNLAKKGQKNIVILEKDTVANGSSGRCGAGFRQQFGTEMNCILARDSVKIFEQLSDELGYDIELNQKGYLIIAYTEKEVNQFQKNIQLENSLNIPARLITPGEAKEIVPALNIKDMLAATYCPTDGNVNPLLTTFAYAEAARRLGVKLYQFTGAQKIVTKGQKIHAVITNQGSILTDTVVNAAGGYAREVGEIAGIKIPVYAQRHQIMVTEPIEPLWEPMLMSFSRNYYFQQLPHGSIIGGYGDPENEIIGHNLGTSWQFAVKMARKMINLIPVLSSVRVVRQWSGSYTMSPDSQPILGEHPQLKGYYMSVGFSGHGFMLAPITGRMLAAYIMEGRTLLPIEKLSITRFERGELILEPSVV
ncbi:MAG: FAD-binding oxidoreductase [Atribacterota bacterium]|nr:FAD-binding oxidoreductase [Atribacterota bacterium]MDD4896764.1 FAD-binding oxidoreductase [Atribacterota bacterium]MDD5636394.1 FAD-binding oxidoreductase [Atribacterota bacterium]